MENIQWTQITIMSLIMSISLYILLIVISIFFNIKHMFLYGFITCIIAFVFFFGLFYYTRNQKNIFIASLLNFSFIYPLGFFYSTEHLLPGFDIKEIVFFIVHYVFLPLSPFITFIAASLNLYPVKAGNKLVFK